VTVSGVQLLVQETYLSGGLYFLDTNYFLKDSDYRNGKLLGKLSSDAQLYHA